MLTGGTALAVASVTALRPGRASADPESSLVEQISNLENDNNALIGLVATDLVSGRSVANRADERFAVCSTFKVYAAGRVLQLVDHGQLSLDHSVVVDPAGVVANSPVTGPRAGTAMTLHEMCEAALQRSDNTAGNLLLTTIGGPSEITAFARSIGDDQSRLDRWETELNSAVPGDPRDTSSPAALAAGFRALLDGAALSTARRALLLDWMRANQTSSMRAGLPQGWTSADKTGSGDYGSTNDVGVVFGPGGRRVLLAVMTRSRADDADAASLRPLVGQLAALALRSL
ncbi:class A beta-lactamase [Mycobacterium sp. OTB74]|jgi:beta-lactamase class A|uniref:class A beta-lactamase n=1 Tax=Mycobacterium sp. OTB74 TaxID=1853452 RepID=UPI00247487D7|nr:class A beta-lactamase [Mycobacterium sp. OTB74]